MTLVWRSCFPSKRMPSLIAVKRTFRFTSSSTSWITWPRLRPRRDHSVPCRQRPEQLVDSPLIPALPGGGLHLDEAIDGKPFLSRVVKDGQRLVGQVLGTGRNPQVGDCFHAPRYEKVE